MKHHASLSANINRIPYMIISAVLGPEREKMFNPKYNVKPYMLESPHLFYVLACLTNIL
jgi:hypothetical protein